MRPAAPAARLVPLDQLRAIAVLLVLWRHAPDAVLAGDQPWHAVGLLLQRGGWVGVDLFFVLSGFLVAGILFREHSREGTIRIGHFLVRRGFKIYPPFYFLIAVTVVRACWKTGGVDGAGLLSEVFFVQNSFSSLWVHTWSLAVEEHFYIFLALLVVLLQRRCPDRPFGSLPRLCLGMGSVILALRVGFGFLHSFTYRSHFFPTGLRIDAMMFGVLLSYGYHYRTEAFARWARRGRRWWLPIGLLGLTPPFLFELEKTVWIYTGGMTLNYLASGALLVGLLTRERPPGGVAKTLARLGAYSYSIYLWHVPVAVWLLPSADVDGPGSSPSFWLWMPVYSIVSLTIGIVMAKVVELPLLALRDRWFPSRSGALPRFSS